MPTRSTSHQISPPPPPPPLTTPWPTYLSSLLGLALPTLPTISRRPSATCPAVSYPRYPFLPTYPPPYPFNPAVHQFSPPQHPIYLPLTLPSLFCTFPFLYTRRDWHTLSIHSLFIYLGPKQQLLDCTFISTLSDPRPYVLNKVYPVRRTVSGDQINEL